MEWIEIIERLPDDSTEVLCTDGNRVYFAEYRSRWDGTDEGYFILCRGVGIVEPFDYYHKKEITHWQPLPETPQR